MYRIKTLVPAGLLGALAFAGSGCFLFPSGSAVSPNTSLSSAGGSSSSAADVMTGYGSMYTPTATAVVSRIQKVLGGAGVNCYGSGNCNKVLNQLETNLPATSNPSNATGLDQIPLLVYAACSDAQASTFAVNTSGTVASNLGALVSAGVSMVNQHVGNLAVSGSTDATTQSLNSQVTSLFTNLVQQDAAAGATTSQTFVSVCMAANAFGVGMTGF